MLTVYDPKKGDNLSGNEAKKDGYLGLAIFFSASFALGFMVCAAINTLKPTAKEVRVKTASQGFAVTVTSKGEILESLKNKLAGDPDSFAPGVELPQDRENLESLIKWVENNPWKADVLLNSRYPTVRTFNIADEEIDKSR